MKHEQFILLMRVLVLLVHALTQLVHPTKQEAFMHELKKVSADIDDYDTGVKNEQL